MKCPKCRYLSFEPEVRCKHCGYDFSMADPGLELQPFDELEQQNPDAPAIDVQLREPDQSPASRPQSSGAARVGSTLSTLSGGSTASAVMTRPPAARPAVAVAAARSSGSAAAAVARPVSSQPTPDLPLFIKDLPGLPGGVPAGAGDTDPVAVPAAPRPLAVRRAPDSGRLQAVPSPAAGALIAAPGPVAPVAAPVPPPAPVIVPRADREVLAYVRRVEIEAAPAALPTAEMEAEPARGDASLRLKAAAVDGALLLAMNVTVALLTVRQCGLTLDQIGELPVLPLAAFLVSLSLTYLLVFTMTGGQTLGKMMYGLRVVSDNDETGPALTPRQLSYRTLLSVASVLLLGLGFLPAFLGDGRALHDRMTHTRLTRV